MKIHVLLSFLWLVIAVQQTTPPVAITAPAAGELLRGEVKVMGNLDVPSFVSAELDFAYASDPTGTWFTIQAFSQPLVNSQLALWDTTSITDGNYILRLRVDLEDGTFQEATVPVQVGNDVPPTPTALPATATSTPEDVNVLAPTPFLLAASPTPTEMPRPTPTPLPANPASLQPKEVFSSLGRGALVILGLFALAGLIIRIRRF